MSQTAPVTSTELALPPSVVTRPDLARLIHEVEQLDNAYTTAAARAKAGVATDVQPSASPQLIDFLQLNTLTISSDARARSQLIARLHALKEQAPQLHMTFAMEADRDSLVELAQWLRSSVHPQALITVGLQPGLVAGVYLRTPNHVHDFSLRGALKNSRGLIVKELEALRARG